MAVAVLVALPALLFGVPALLGHPVLPGDDLTQNFPLRVLAGREIRSGHLPLFDAYDWSGSPLLAGWNAGAAYPLTWLFGVLPGAAAWTIGMIATWVTAGTGTFAFLRALCLRPLPSFLGALSFALAGAMAAQAPHFGLVAGMSWVPLALLGVQKLTSFSLTNSLTNHSDSPGSTGWWSSRRNLSRPDLSRRGPRWTAVLAVAVGLIILAGEPRAIVDGFTIIGLYAVWQVGRLWFAGSSGASGLSGRRWFSWQHGRRALPAAALIAAGCLLGVGLGAVQWLPGLASIASSQRGTGSMALFSSGSLPPEWLTLTLIPDLLGGSGTLSQPPFFANYGLAEVTSYVGILPLVAAFALLVRAFGGRLPGTRRSEYLIWHVMGVVGIALALGGKSPLGQVLYRLPLFGSQRLQSRNILLLDLALAVLLAFWLNDPFPNAPRLRRGSLEAGESRLRARAVAETLAGVLPPIGILVLVVLSLTWGAGLLRWVGTGPARAADGIGPLRPWLIPTAVLAVAAVALVVFGHGVFRHGVFGHGVFGHRGLGRRLGRRWWGRACAGFVAVDVMVFTVLAVTRVAPTPSPSPSTAAASPAAGASLAASAAARPGAGQSGSSRSGADQAGTGPSATPSAARPISALGYPGRFAIYDPGLLDSAELSTLGPPDVNALDSTPSVQGYSSIVNGSYASATGSHSADGGGQNVLSPAAIGNGTLDSLNTSVLLTLPSYLTTTAEPGGSAAGSSAAGRRTIQAGQNATWYLGESVTVSRVSVPDRDARTDAARGTEIGLMAPGGATSWYPARAASATSLEISLPRPMAATTVLARAGDAGSAGVSRLTDVSWPTGIARSSRASGSSRPAGTSGPAGASGRADTPTVLTAGSGPEGDTGRVLGAASVTLAGGRVLVANGALQNDLTAPRWDMAGFDGQFAVFTDRFASGPLTVQPRPAASGSAASGSPGSAALSGSSSSGSSSSGAVSGSAGGGSSGSGAGLASVRYTTSAAGSVTAATVSSAHGVRLVRSMAAIPGWTALWQPRHGRPVTLNVQRDGIVQAIDVPPGQGTVTWRYTTPRLELGLAVSAAAALCTAALAIGRGPRRRRAESVAPGPERERGFSRSAV